MRLTQLGFSHGEIKKLLSVKKSLISKWLNYDNRNPKRPKNLQKSIKILFIKLLKGN